MLGKLFKRTDENGRMTISGEIATYSMRAELSLDPNSDRRDDKSPSHNIMIKAPHGGWVYAGVAWEGNHAEHGAYISMELEVPELFENGLALMAGASREQIGSYIVRHAKPRAEQKAA